MKTRGFVYVLVCSALAAAACAQGLLAGDPDAGGGDATVGDSGACPQYNTTNDPKHCGSCTTACASDQVCSSSVCKAQCDTPTTKCANGDGGSFCASLASDPNHCGGCTNVCSLADAGGLVPGSTNNPDAGVPLNGYDAGTGWNLGTAICDAATCGVTCPAGMTACSDGICYDTNNYHDHCGTCTTACAPTEWCNHANCCPQGQEYCGTACTDVLTDNSNCGTCGNVCSGTTPYCSAGTCVMGCVPTGTRQPFNTLASSTAVGCWTGNPCGTDTYSWSPTNGVSFEGTSQAITCSGTTACIGHVGINTYASTTECQGQFDVYCNSTKVGSIDTVGKACQGSAMTNGCDTTFTPVSCSTIKLVLTAGAGTDLCCLTSGTGPDTMVSGVSAW